MSRIKVLKAHELIEVFAASDKEKRNLFVSGLVVLSRQEIVLLRGDGDEIIAPFNMFVPSGTGCAPDFTQLEIIDYGHTVKLGEYEASTHSILMDLDPDYKSQH
jgi:hypothetical protein